MTDTFHILIKTHQIQRKSEIPKENEENKLIWISNTTARKRFIMIAVLSNLKEFFLIFEHY
jgi:hypothetical protein